MRSRLRYLLGVLLFFMVQSVCAQQYPVTASTQVIPPYSVYLPDYAVPGSDKLRVILVQNDLTQPSYDVILQMTVEQNGTLIMRTSAAFHPRPLTLTSGVPTIIGGADLSAYLSTNNIDFSGGFSRENYDRTKALPEGAYRITFTAFDYRRPTVQVSNAGSNVFFFQKSEPPLLNLPVCGSRVEKHDPQFLSFNWSNRNTPNSSTEYVFSLYEIKPKNSNADYIVRSAQPLYTVTTESNTLIYGPGEPPLIDSMEYVWIVQARDKMGRDLFSNQGYSRSCKFTYLGTNPFQAHNINKPVLYGHSNGERSVKFWWPLGARTTQYSVETYRIQYRASAKDGVEYDWYTEERRMDSTLTLHSLEPGRRYEARLQWRVSGVYGPYSELVTATTDSLRIFSCGDGGQLKLPDNSRPLPSAIAGNIVRIGNFDVMLTQVMGGDGVFSGTGRVITPGFGMGLPMTFNGISINSDFVVIRGEMQAITSGIDKFVSDELKNQRGGDEVGQVKTGDIVPAITTKLHIFTKDNIKVDTTSGTITLTDGKGGKEVIDYVKTGKTLPVVVEDADGHLYNIDKNGTVTDAGTRDKSINTATLNNLDLSKGRITFSAASTNKYAFDTWKDAYAGKAVLDSSYELLGDYRVSSKAIIPGAQEDVIATLDNLSIDTARIKFVSGKGIAYPFKNDGNHYTVRITGGPAGDAQEVFAVYGNKSIGKLLVVSYAPKQRKVVLIPIGSNTSVPEAAIRNSLEKAYAKIGVTYSITTDTSFQQNTSWDINSDNVLQDSKSAFLGNSFTGEEKAMKKAYAAAHNIIDDVVYLFVVNEAVMSGADLLGKMPRQSQFGFIFIKGASAEDIGRAVAHETGHGAYTLEHTFSNGIGLSQGSTDNLMDYSDGYGLLKYQWDAVHDPGHVWGVFEGDEEGQLTKGLSLYKCLDKSIQDELSVSKKRLFYAPDGTVLELPDSAVVKSVFYQDFSTTNPAMKGSVASFIYRGKEYFSTHYKTGGKFYGYTYNVNIPGTFIKTRNKKKNEIISTIQIGEDLYSCEVKIDGKIYSNKDCLCQDNLYTSNYKKLMTEVAGSDKPEVKAEIDRLCRLLTTLPKEVLQTNNELFDCYYENPELYWMDWNVAPSVLSFEQLKKIHQELIDLDANVEKLKKCDFKDGIEILEFINEHFVTPGTKTSYLTYSQFTDLTPQTRACLIEKMVDATFDQRWTVGSSHFGGQNITVELLRNCKTSQELYEVITILDKDKKLYKVLSKTYDNLYVSNGSFTKLSNAITIAWLNVAQPALNVDTVANAIVSGRYMLFDNGYLTATNEEEYGKDGKIHFEISDGFGVPLVDGVNQITPGAKWLFKDFGKAAPFKGGFDPLQYLIVVPQRDIHAFGTVFQKGMPQILPALSVYQLFKMDTKAAIGTSTQLVLNGLACAIGASGLTAASGTAIALETVDIGLFTFVTYANSAPEMAQDHPQFVKYTNYLAFAYMVGRIGHTAFSAATVRAPAEMVVTRYADDALEIERRAISLGSGDVKMAEDWLSKTYDKNIYIIVHGEKGSFSIVHNGVEEAITHNSVRRWIDGNAAIIGDKQIVLLSCSDLKTAQNVCNGLGREIVANNGWVKVYENGVIETEHSLMKLKPNKEAEAVEIKIGNSGGTAGQRMIKLRSGELENAELINQFKSKVEMRVTQTAGKFELLHSDEEILALINKGKELEFSDELIEDLIFVSCRSAKPITASELMTQMDYYVLVLKRGYPAKFTDLAQFNQFKAEFKAGVEKIGFPDAELRIQGSALRTTNADDVDLAVHITDKEFNGAIVKRFNKKATKNGEAIRLEGLSDDELKAVVMEIDADKAKTTWNNWARSFSKAMKERKISTYSSDDIIPGGYELYKQLQTNYPNLNVRNVSIQVSEGSFDLLPYLKL